MKVKIIHTYKPVRVKLYTCIKSSYQRDPHVKYKTVSQPFEFFLSKGNILSL